MREFRKTVRFSDRKLEARIVTITPDFLAQNNIRVALGRGITSTDEARFANVCVLGGATADVLFPASDPIGRSVTVEDVFGNKSYVVVGVTEPKTLAAGSGGQNLDFNRVVFIPFASDKVRFGRELLSWKTGSFQAEKLEISQITVTVGGVDDVRKTAAALTSVIDQIHPEKDVQIVVPLDLLEKAEETQRLFTLVLGAIAGISLLVGGIGIMNIMLASVTERTREIGIRRALGAKRRDVAAQFLVETVTLSCGGGLLGVGMGIGLSFLLTSVADLPTIIQPWSPVLAFSVSVVVGLLSGIYPARAAARLDPIEALRHE
jgi:putative ABC transport system permease protein